jgi:hypothetical protein
LQHLLDYNEFFLTSGEINPAVIETCQNFLKRLGIPEEVQSTRNLLGMIVMLAPSSAGNLGNFFSKSIMI